MGQNEMKLEYRGYQGAELRMTNERRLVGHAAVFDQISDMGGGYEEKIARGAFAKTLKTADVRLLINHDGLPLARTKSGTLLLEEDEIGLRFEAELDTTDPDVQRLIPKMQRGDVNQMSFGFYTKRDSWKRNEGGSIRTLEEVELYDISVVTFPAYPQTDVAVRSAQEIYDSYIASLRAQEDAVEIERQRALDARARQIQLGRYR